MFNTKWDSDSTQPHCFHCKNKFTLFLRKHHCRKCGKIFCNNCMKKIKICNNSQIVCTTCINTLSNSILINRSDLQFLKTELLDCRQTILELTIQNNNANENNENIYTSSNIITYNTDSTQTYTIQEDKSTQTTDISTTEIDTQTTDISTNEIDTQTTDISTTEIDTQTTDISTNEIDTQTTYISTNEIETQTDTNNNNSDSFTQTNEKTKSLDILECIENVSKKNPIKRISSEEQEILKYNNDKLKRREQELIKKNTDILRKQSEIFNAQKESLQKQLISLKNQEELLQKKEQDLILRENELKKLHVNEIIETSHNKATEIRDLCKTKELEDKIKKQNTDMIKLKEQNDSIQKKYKSDLLQKQKDEELKAQRDTNLLQKQKNDELKAQCDTDLLQKQKEDEIKAKRETDLLQKQKEDKLKNKQVVKNMSTRELVLQRKLEKKKLEEQNYKKALENIHNSYQEDVKNSKKVY